MEQSKIIDTTEMSQSARRRDDGDDDATGTWLLLSTATILSRCNMMEGVTAHG